MAWVDHAHDTAMAMGSPGPTQYWKHRENISEATLLNQK
jgi:hypothetical protein